MRLRSVLACLAQLAACGLPLAARAQSPRPVLADMHTHVGFRIGRGYRTVMARGGMLIVADKIVPDGPLLKPIDGRHTTQRRARPGELRHNFEQELARRLAQLEREGLPHIVSAESLDATLAAMKPALVLGVEGADFLEGDLSYLQTARARGLVQLQLVHYYVPSLIADVATEPALHHGLAPFGKELVRACNRLGILIDVAHCSSAGIEQTLELSSRPIVYSHGHVSAAAPHPAQNWVAARAIHLPLARRIAAKGGVVGLWSLGTQFREVARFADELVAVAAQLGAAHVGIGSDMVALQPSVLPSYVDFALLPGLLAQRGLSAADIAGIVGGNYLRVLRQALQDGG